MKLDVQRRWLLGGIVAWTIFVFGGCHVLADIIVKNRCRAAMETLVLNNVPGVRESLGFAPSDPPMRLSDVFIENHPINGCTLRKGTPTDPVPLGCPPTYFKPPCDGGPHPIREFLWQIAGR